MSSYSASRHLVVELTAFGPELQRFRTELAQAIRARCPAGAPATDRIATALERTSDPQRVGALVCELLELLRHEAGPAGLRFGVQGALRDLCDREVTLLADVIERPRP